MQIDRTPYSHGILVPLIATGVLLALLAMGCATSEITLHAGDATAETAQNPTQLKANLTRQAFQFCAKKHQGFVVLSQTEADEDHPFMSERIQCHGAIDERLATSYAEQEKMQKEAMKVE